MAPEIWTRDEFPEIDRADFFEVAAAGRKIKAPQMALVEECERIAWANLRKVIDRPIHSRQDLKDRTKSGVVKSVR